MLGFHLYFDIRHNEDGRVVSSTHLPYFVPKEISWYSFLLEYERTPGLLNANRRNKLLKNFQEPNRVSNPEPEVLWQIISTDCTVYPHLKALTWL
jgi:hypothetical protein